MAKKRENMFKGRTRRSMEKPKNNYGYLKLPEEINMFKPEGNTEVVFDIIPYVVSDPEHLDNKKYSEDAVVGDMWWKRPIKVHRDVGESVAICPTTFGKRCPICEYASRKRKEGMEWEELKEIYPKNRSLFLIVLRDAGDCEVDYEEGEVHIMDQSDFLFLQNLDDEIQRDIDNEGFPDPFDGLSLRVYWKGKKLGKNKYAEATKIDFEQREEQYDEDFLKDMPCLDDILIVHDYKELQALYFGMEGMDDDDPEDDDDLEIPEDDPKPAKRSRKTTKPDPEPEEDEEEEEEEEEPPVKRQRKTTKPTPKKKKEKPSAKKLECPVGLRFGKDFDEYEECDTCKIYDDCMEANKALTGDE
jgi:hypothetical protein